MCVCVSYPPHVYAMIALHFYYLCLAFHLCTEFYTLFFKKPTMTQKTTAPIEKHNIYTLYTHTVTSWSRKISILPVLTMGWIQFQLFSVFTLPPHAISETIHSFVSRSRVLSAGVFVRLGIRFVMASALIRIRPDFHCSIAAQSQHCITSRNRARHRHSRRRRKLSKESGKTKQKNARRKSNNNNSRSHIIPSVLQKKKPAKFNLRCHGNVMEIMNDVLRFSLFGIGIVIELFKVSSNFVCHCIERERSFTTSVCGNAYT